MKKGLLYSWNTEDLIVPQDLNNESLGAKTQTEFKTTLNVLFTIMVIMSKLNEFV